MNSKLTVSKYYNSRLRWIEIFNKNYFRYCIIRDENEAIVGTALEVDILLSVDDLSSVKLCLLEEGYVLRSKFSNYPHFPFYLYNEKQLIFILDIVIDIRVGRNSTLWSLGCTEETLHRSTLKRNTPVLCGVDEFAYTLLHEIVDKKKIREKWMLGLQTRLLYIHDVRGKLEVILESKSLANNLVHLISERKAIELAKLRNKIRLRLFYKSFFSNLFVYIRSIIGVVWEKLWRKGPRVISFLGIDGAGKSTIINRLENQQIEGRKVVKCILGHGSERHYIFPITALICPVSENIKLEAISFLQTTQGALFSRFLYKLWKYLEKIKPLRNLLSTLLIPLLFWLEDYIELNKVKKKLPRNAFVLTDRHLVDGVVFDVFKKGQPTKLKSFFYHFIALYPHLMVYVNCSGELAYERKQELVAETGNKLNGAYQKWLINYYKKPQIWLDSAIPIESACHQLKTILKKLE